MAEVQSAPWKCPSCDGLSSAKFCSECGEKPAHPRDMTIRGVMDLTYRAFSPVDGKVLRSFRELLLRPGALTAAFQAGLRQPYIGPFQIFLLANVLFFAIESISTLNIFTNGLAFILNDQPGSAFGQILVDRRLAATGQSFAQYAPVFDQAVAVHAKSLIGLMIPPFALLLPVVFWAGKRPLAVHVVFALHFYAFLLVLFCVPLLMTAVEAWFGGAALMTRQGDIAISLTILAAVAVYLFMASGVAYGARGPWRYVQALALTSVAMGLFMAYRFALLPITLYTT